MSVKNHNGDNKEQVFDPQRCVKLVNQLFEKETIETILAKDMYVMEFNISLKTHSNIYIPIEVGVVKFSIKDGIKDSFHDFIDPGRVPLGYTATANDLYLKYHGIPGYGFSDENYNKFCEHSMEASRCDDLKNYHHSIREAIKRIDAFVKPETVFKEAEDGKPGLNVRPVFSHPVDYDGVAQTDGCLKRLAMEAENMSFYDSFQVMDIIHMLKFACRLKSETADQPYAVFGRGFSTKILDPPYDKCCKFHYEIDNYNCALAKAHAVTYCFLDYACPHYPVLATAKHVPTPLGPPKFDQEWEEHVQNILRHKFC